MAPKRNRIGLNDLPDSLLILILNKVSLKEAVSCSVLSKRWKFLWTFLPDLKFSSWKFSSSRIVDCIFELHSGPLELFEFSNFSSSSPSDKICEWIHCAALKDVRDIRLEENTGCPYELPTSIFLCHKLRSLTLNNFLLTNIPDSFGGFTALTTLDFYDIELNDMTLELLLQLCPVLEILIICECYGLKKLKICSNSLISLNLSQTWIRAITANCPRLVSLTLIKKLCDIEMQFYLPACLSLCTNCTNKQLERFTSIKSLRKITFLNLILKRDANTLSKFPDLEQMCTHSVEDLVSF